jgi:CheY-like chemotaxis protein
MMPGMTGQQLADRAITEHPNLKVLYTTGYTHNTIVHNGILDYGVLFLAKLFSIEARACVAESRTHNARNSAY